MRPMTQLCRLILSGFMLLAINANAGDLKPYKISYTAKYTFLLPFNGTATRELSQSENGDWTISHKVVSSLIQLDETSHFRMKDSRIIASQYEYIQTGLGRKRHTLIEFDWNNKKVVGSSIKKKAFSYDLQQGTLDKLTYQLQLRRDLMAGNEYGNYRIADIGRTKEYAFEFLGEELLNTEVGQLNTLKLRRKRDPDAARETLVWLATDWDYLVVQLHQIEKGKLYKIMVTKASLDGESMTGVAP